MDISQLIALCQKWDALGTAVQRQLADVLEGQSVAEQNANAMRLAAKFLDACVARGIEGADDVRDALRYELTQETDQ